MLGPPTSRAERQDNQAKPGGDEGRQCRSPGRPDQITARLVDLQTVTCVPISTTRPVGIWKKSVASLAVLVRPMKRWSCHGGMPECAEGLSARRDRKNDVDMMSNVQPCLRATASALGTFGCSM